MGRSPYFSHMHLYGRSGGEPDYSTVPSLTQEMSKQRYILSLIIRVDSMCSTDADTDTGEGLDWCKTSLSHSQIHLHLPLVDQQMMSLVVPVVEALEDPLST